MGTFRLHFYPIPFNCFLSTLIWTYIEQQPLSFLPASSFLSLRYFLFKGICSPSPHASVSSEAPVLILTQPVELGKEPSLSTRKANLSLPSLESFTGSKLTLGVQEISVHQREPMLCPARLSRLIARDSQPRKAHWKVRGSVLAQYLLLFHPSVQSHSLGDCWALSSLLDQSCPAQVREPHTARNIKCPESYTTAGKKKIQVRLHFF